MSLQTVIAQEDSTAHSQLDSHSQRFRRSRHSIRWNRSVRGCVAYHHCGQVGLCKESVGFL